MNRLAAQQVWPVLYIRPQTAHLTVWSRSASSRTMNASLPPSSIEDTLRFFPARAAMLRPAATLPVSATPLMRGSSTTRFGLLVRDQKIGVQADRRARLDQELLEGDRALRHDAGVLHHQDVARHQVGTGDPGQLVVGEVPGLDAEDHADRAALHVGFADGRIEL